MRILIKMIYTKKSCNPIQGFLRKISFSLPQEEIQSDGYVVHTLEAAIWCLGNSNSFSDAVLKAVNLGDDTDTVGAITGTMAGMYYKMDDIPKEWLEKITRKEDIDKLIEQFHRFCTDKAIKEKVWGLM
ncbi:ADP-ribosylglycohydrolase family protein [Peribacillus frigoritolerans]|nr:ADP-ribosylglycohydrolase family protein [Peribacillus frigoritolerans]